LPISEIDPESEAVLGFEKTSAKLTKESGKDLCDMFGIPQKFYDSLHKKDSDVWKKVINTFKGNSKEEISLLIGKNKSNEDNIIYRIIKGKPPKNDKWKEKYKEPAKPDVAELPRLPDNWTWVTTEALALDCPRSIQSGPFGSNLLHSEFQDSGILAIGIDNVLEGRFSLGSQHRISPTKFRELKKYEARPLDVLITVMATVGRCCVVPADMEPAIITKHVYRITPDQGLIHPSYLMFALWGASVVRWQMKREIRGQTRPGINGYILRNLAIPLPPPKEQLLIVQDVEYRLSHADDLTTLLGRSQQRYDRLRQSILKRAFEGKLVEQDASDEPASILLERIKAERENEQAKTNSKPKRRKRVAAVTKSAGRKRSRAKADQPELF
ncbi:MAG: restriction endonuclease subunit S, partial [Planctomycetes bacterium]|nr:restriction endonuclease subunit S [Planctomycetota bacterium]